jgi:TetR/AcrR family transcriptional regulator, transcriptional repressor for nem operon
MASSRRDTLSSGHVTASSRHATASSTAADILDAAERLVQSRGFNGFSYADVSSELGITKAALHYHFAGKAELGESLISRYNERFDAALEAIDATEMSAADKLLAYCELYRGTLRGQRMCLCGMLAAEYNTLGEPMRVAIGTFFDHNRDWLAALLESGRKASALGFEGPSEKAAQTIIAALEGAMLVARPYNDTAVLDVVIDRLLADFALKQPA